MTTAPRALVHNWRLKASALGLAVFLWALVQAEPRSEEIFSSVPVRVEMADTLWTVAGLPSPATVDLRVDGPAEEIIRLARDGARVRIPVATVGSRDTVIELDRDFIDVGQGSGLVVTSVSPTTVRVFFEPAVMRLVPVSMRLQGRISESLALSAGVTVDPELVRVRGAESRVLALDSISLQAFDLARVTGSGLYTVAVDTAGLWGASVFPPSAALEVRVEDMVQRVLDDVAVEAVATEGQAEVVVDPQFVRLTLSGARTVVTAFDPALLRVWVSPESIRDMAPGEERTVRLFVDGVPELVTAVPAVDFVIVRREIDVIAGDPEQPRS